MSKVRILSPRPDLIKKTAFMRYFLFWSEWRDYHQWLFSAKKCSLLDTFGHKNTKMPDTLLGTFIIYCVFGQKYNVFYHPMRFMNLDTVVCLTCMIFDVYGRNILNNISVYDTMFLYQWIKR